MLTASNLHLISRLRKIDWDFVGQYSESPFSSIHWHPGRFASQLPATLIGSLSKPGDLVVDPFAGSGTTLVEAQRLGRRSIGIDLNPISCLTTTAKVLPIPAHRIARGLREIKDDAAECLGDRLVSANGFQRLSSIPATVQVAKWYSRRVSVDLGLLWKMVCTYSGTKRTLADAAFSAVLLPVCRETRHWGYVCDNSSPKTDHEADVLQNFCRVLDRLKEAYEERDAEYVAREGDVSDIPDAKVICADALGELKRAKTGSIDLVVTSPPYFGVADYVKSQRLSMEWFGHEIESLRLREVGARSKRHRKSADQDYLEDVSQVFSQVRRCLHDGGFCAVLMGESSARSSILPRVRNTLESCGFNLKLDLNRRVSSQRRQAPSIKGEHLFLFSK
jgi:DNA modification methylase